MSEAFDDRNTDEIDTTVYRTHLNGGGHLSAGDAMGLLEEIDSLRAALEEAQTAQKAGLEVLIPLRVPSSLPRDDREHRLPNWCQQLLHEIRYRYLVLSDRYLSLLQAHEVLTTRRWFTLPGPAFSDPRTNRKLWVLDQDMPMMLCDLGKGDILLVGRANDSETGPDPVLSTS
jgi:hypothetical protein